MKTKLMAMMLVAGGSLFAETHFSIGVNVGGPRGYYAPTPVAVAAYRPACPGPGYIWIDGYNDEYGNWIDGYWSLPPYAGAYWIAPRFYGGRFFAGYWGGARYYDRDDFRFRESHLNEFRERERGDFDRYHYRGYEQDRNRGVDQGRSFSDQDRNQNRGFNQGQTRDFGRNQAPNQNGGNRNRSNDPGSRQNGGNGFRGR